MNPDLRRGPTILFRLTERTERLKLVFIMNQGSRTFLDWLIVFDCFLCLNNLDIVMLLVNFSDIWDGLCICHVFFSLFTNLCNRLLTIWIVIYRLTLVLGSSLVWTTYQRKIFEKMIVLVILLLSFFLTGWAVYYREDYKSFLGITWILIFKNTLIKYLLKSLFRKKSRVLLQYLRLLPNQSRHRWKMEMVFSFYQSILFRINC